LSAFVDHSDNSYDFDRVKNNNNSNKQQQKAASASSDDDSSSSSSKINNDQKITAATLHECADYAQFSPQLRVLSKASFIRKINNWRKQQQTDPTKCCAEPLKPFAFLAQDQINESARDFKEKIIDEFGNILPPILRAPMRIFKIINRLLMGAEFWIGGNLHGEDGKCPHCGAVLNRHPTSKKQQHPTIHFFACTHDEVKKIRQEVFGGHEFNLRFKKQENDKNKNNNKSASSTSNKELNYDDEEQEEKNISEKQAVVLDLLDNDIDQLQGAAAAAPPFSQEIPDWVDARVLWTHPSLVIDYFIKWRILAKNKKNGTLK